LRCLINSDSTSLLFSIALLETFINAISVLLIAPITDCIMGKAFTDPNNFTLYFIRLLEFIGLEPTFKWAVFAFIISCLMKGLVMVGVIFTVLWVKRSVTCDLLKEALSCWEHPEFLTQSFLKGKIQPYKVNIRSFCF